MLDTLESEHVKKAFVDAFSGVLKHPDTKKAVYAICILQEVYGGVIDKSLIATLTESNHVYTSDLDERVLESSIFEFRKYKPVTTSAIFGQFMLRNLFDGSYSVDQLIAIYVVIEKHYDTMSYEEQEIRRRIMTFGTLSKIFPTENRQRSYPLFYDKLKRQVPRVEGNPHYWLQYAMGVMSTHNLPDAERLLRTAYSKAERIEDYDTTYQVSL